MRDILDILQDGFSFETISSHISLQGLIATLAVAFFCALAVYFTYRFFYPGLIYSSSFNLLLILVTLITAMIIMTISANIVLSLGMVGALSIVRFRSAVKDPLDIGFLFLGIGAGLTAGAGLYLIAVCGTLIICLIYILMLQFRRSRTSYLLMLQYSPDAENFVGENMANIPHKMKNKTLNKDFAELTAEVKLKKNSGNEILELFNKNEFVHSASLVEYSAEHSV